MLMIVEIIGERRYTAKGQVTVKYINGKTVTYDSKHTKHLILNPSQIKYVSIAKE